MAEIFPSKDKALGSVSRNTNLCLYRLTWVVQNKYVFFFFISKFTNIPFSDRNITKVHLDFVVVKNEKQNKIYKFNGTAWPIYK